MSNWAHEEYKRRYPLNHKLRKELIALYGKNCSMCGFGPLPKHDMTVDHIKPKILGGVDHIRNVQLLCKDCHRRKTKEDEKYVKTLMKAYTRYDKNNGKSY